MKKLYNLILTLLVFSISFAQEPATFTVEVPAGTQAVRMTGNFWGWDPTGGPVATSNGLDNTWSVTLFAGGGESQSDFEYLWVIVDADLTSNPMQENLIPSAVGGDCLDRINAGEFNTDYANYANRKFLAAGSDDIKSDVYGSCYLATGPLELKGVIAFEAGGTQGKALHLYANDDIADLSNYGLGTANNGGGTDGIEYQFPVQAVSAGSHIYVPRNTAWMTSYFINLDVFDIVIEAGVANQNGDDAIELFDNVVPDGGGGWTGSVIETFGDLNCAPTADGTSVTCPSFQYYGNSWAYKALGAWTYGGTDCTGTGTVNTASTQASSCPYPLSDSTLLSNGDFLKSELSIYPNPVNSGLLNIKSQLSGLKNIELYDILGRTVLQKSLNSDILDVQSLKSGMYMLKVSIDDRSSTTKIIIQ